MTDPLATDFQASGMAYSELEVYASALEDRNRELELSNRALVRTVLAKNIEIKALRCGLVELGYEYPHLRQWAHDLTWGSVHVES